MSDDCESLLLQEIVFGWHFLIVKTSSPTYRDVLIPPTEQTTINIIPFHTYTHIFSHTTPTRKLTEKYLNCLYMLFVGLKISWELFSNFRSVEFYWFPICTFFFFFFWWHKPTHHCTMAECVAQYPYKRKNTPTYPYAISKKKHGAFFNVTTRITSHIIIIFL